MEILLMICCMSLFGIGVACLAFGTATRTEPHAPDTVSATTVKAAAGPAFFAETTRVPVLAMSQALPIEALLLQIETHIRLEQSAAESFIQLPTAAMLHTKTMSPLIH
jgi:hypothetical protein